MSEGGRSSPQPSVDSAVSEKETERGREGKGEVVGR